MKKEQQVFNICLQSWYSYYEGIPILYNALILPSYFGYAQYYGPLIAIKKFEYVKTCQSKMIKENFESTRMIDKEKI